MTLLWALQEQLARLVPALSIDRGASAGTAVAAGGRASTPSPTLSLSIDLGSIPTLGSAL
jgi:hypothetical protein